MKRLLFWAMLLVSLRSMAQLAAYTDQGFGVNPFGRTPIFLSGGQIRVCSATASGNPCTPVATVYDSLGNPLSIPTSQFGQVTADSVGRFSFQCTPGIYLIQGQAVASNTPSIQYQITCPSVGGAISSNNTWAGTNTFNGLATFNSATAFNSSATFSGPTSFSSSNTFSGPASFKVINNIQYADQFPTGDAAAKTAAAITALGGQGTVFVNFTGNQTWGSTVTIPSKVNVFFQGCATYDATALTTTPFLTTSAGTGDWKFVGAGQGTGGSAGPGCTVFKVANTSGPNINLVDQEMFELGGFAIQKSTSSGGDIMDAAYIQTGNVHDISSYSVTSGAKWVNGFVLNSDANGSTIYNIFTNVQVLAFGIGVGSISGNCMSITGGTGGKVTNQNVFLQTVCGPHPGATGLSVAGGSTQTNENLFFGADFSGNATGVNVVANSARNLWLQITSENNSGTGVAIGAGNLYTKCFGCEITGNGVNVSDSGTASFWHGNVGGATPIGVTPAGGITVPTGGGMGFGAGISGADALNFANGYAFLVGGATIAQAVTNGWQLFTNKGTLYNEGTPAGANATQDVCSGSSTAHALQCSYNGGSFLSMPQVVAAGTSAMTTAGIATGACGTTVTTAATGAATTDAIHWSRNAAPTNGNGGNLILNAWTTSGNVNFNYCNPSAGTVTPTAMTVNWEVIR